MKISLWKKMTVCLLAGVMGVYCIHSDISHYLALGIPEAIISIPALALFICAIIYIPVWQYLENKQKLDSASALAFWQGIIIYLEAYVFFRFGLLKLLGLHMQSSLVFSDFPADSISGYQLMNYFFGRAPAFKLIIGGLQLAGAAALLFRRTRLIGIFILLPVIVNVACMDIFYEVGGGITITAILLLIGLIYLLFQEKEKLILFFLDSRSNMPEFVFKKKIVKNVLRLSSLLIPLLTLIPSVKPVQNTSIIGKYSVTALRIKEKDIVLDLNKDSILTTVYFDENETCVLRYNDYRNIKIGKASYNDGTQVLKINWRYPKNQSGTSLWQLSKPDAKNVRILSGEMDQGNFRATLLKVALPAVVLKK